MDSHIDNKMEFASFLGSTKINKTRQISLIKFVAELMDIKTGDFISYYQWNGEIFIRKGGLQKAFVYPEGFSPMKEMSIEELTSHFDWSNYLISGKIFEDLLPKDLTVLSNSDLEAYECELNETKARLEEHNLRIRNEWLVRATKDDPDYEGCEDIYRKQKI